MRDLLKYRDIASAGQPVDLTGEAIVQLGALLTQMDFGFEEKEAEKIDDGVSAKQKAKQKAEDVFGKNPFGEGNTALDEYLAPQLTGYGRLGLKSRPQTTVAEKKPVNTEEVIEEDTNLNFGTFMNVGGSFGLPPYSYSERPVNKPVFVPMTQRSGGIAVLPGVGKRLKPEVLKAIDSLRYKNKGNEDTPLRRVIHAVQSPFLQTEGVDYRQLKRAVIPEYAKGRLGAAAAEGFNLVIDKYNYDQAVKADYEQELDDEMGSLNVEADFLSDEARQNYLALGMEKKKRLADAFNQYANGDISKLDYENIKSTLVSEINAAAAARTNLTKLRGEYLENKGIYDIDASDKEMVDFYNTLEKNPEALSIKNINGVDYVSGKTRENALIKVPVSKIANGTAGFRLVENASLAPIMAGAEKLINKYQQDTKTKFGFGRATASPEKAKEIGVAYIKNNLAADENKLRSYMAKLGVDHTLYQEFVKADGAITDEMLNDAAEELYDRNIGNVYFQQVQTTRFATPKTGATTAGERTQKQMLDKFNAMGLPTADNILDYSINVLGGKEFEVMQLEDGTYGVVKQGTEDTLSILDLNKPEQAKKILFNYAGLKPYSLPTKK